MSTVGDGAEPTVLTPPSGGRGNIVGGVLLGILGLGIAAIAVFVPFESEERGILPILIVGAVALIAYAVLVLVRSPKLGVVLYSDRAVVAGVFGSRTVLRASIENVAPYPALVWRDESGRRHSTRINALTIWRSADDAPAEIREDVAQKVQILIDWAHAGRNAFSQQALTTAQRPAEPEDPFKDLGI